jgi:uncharacterized protein (UPF0335 family)
VVISEKDGARLMGLAIYKGTVVTVRDEDGGLVSIEDGSEELAVEKDSLTMIQDGAELRELLEIKERLKALTERMNRLDAEYSRKTESLRETYMEARAAEQAIINRILKKKKRHIKGGEVIE